MLDDYRQSLEAAKKGPDPIHIDLVTPVTSGKGTPGFENHGNTCYVNASLVGFIESLSGEQLDGIVARIDGMDMSAAQNVARGFVNLTRAYRAGAIPKETDEHLQKLLKACYFMGQADLAMEEAGEKLKQEYRDAHSGEPLPAELLKKTEPPSHAFSEFYPSHYRLTNRQEDAQQFIEKLSEVLGMKQDASRTVTYREEHSTEIDGVTLRKPASASEAKVIISVPLNTDVELAADVQGVSPQDYLDQFRGKVPGLPKKLPLPTVQGCLDCMFSKNKMSVKDPINWDFNSLKDEGNYDEVVAAAPNIKEKFVFDEDGEGTYRAQSSIESQLTADLTQLKNMTFHFKLFEFDKKTLHSSKMPERCDAMLAGFEEDVTVPVRHTDGQLYEVVLRPVSIAAHKGRNVATGHYIGYSRNDDGSWTSHNDERVKHLGGLKDATANPYIVTYEVIGIGSEVITSLTGEDDTDQFYDAEAVLEDMPPVVEAEDELITAPNEPWKEGDPDPIDS